MKSLFPGISIAGVAKASGQRVVYFCKFSPPPLNIKGIPEYKDWSVWGDVVLKVSSGMDAHSIAYLQMEIAVLNSLDSPHYPKMHYYELFVEDPDTGEKLPERLFVTIETRIDAEPLSACQDRFRDERSVIDLLLKLIDALALLWGHEKKLVHRDLKPDNILINKTNGVAIIDLGILRETGATGITATHAIFGPLSCHYTSPEQATNDKKNISFKSDLFALATIAYELMAMQNPYAMNPGLSFHEILTNVINHVPPRADTKSKCSKNFANILEKMMQKDPYRRYRTPASLREELKALQGVPT